MGNEVTKATPEELYRQDVERRASEFLTTITDPAKRQEASARVALAFRTAAWKNPDVYNVSAVSVARAIANCALTGLMPGGPRPQVELIPRRIEGVWQLDWQVTSEGWIAMARWAGWDVTCMPVFEGEKFAIEYGGNGLSTTPSRLEHMPDVDQPWTFARLRLFYVVARRGAEVKLRMVQKSKIDELRKYAQTDKVWAKSPLEMAEKAALAYVLRRRWIELATGGEQLPTEDSEGGDDSPNIPLGTVRNNVAIDLPPARGVAAVIQRLAAEPSPPSSSPTSQSPPAAPSGGDPLGRGMVDPAAVAAEWRAAKASLDEWESSLSTPDRQRMRAEAGIMSIRSSTPVDRIRTLIAYYEKVLGPPEVEPEPEPTVVPEDTGWLTTKVMAAQNKLSADLCASIMNEIGLPAVDGAPAEMLATYLRELEEEIANLEGT